MLVAGGNADDNNVIGVFLHLHQIVLYLGLDGIAVPLHQNNLRQT